MKTQYERVLSRWGMSPCEIAKILHLSPSTVYRWGYPKPFGTGGYIPQTRMAELSAKSRLYGVLMLAEDFDQRPL